MGEKFVMNVMSSERGEVVAICDFSLLGKLFEEDDKILDLTSPFFTAGEIATIGEIVEEIKRAYTVNIVGNAIIEELISLGIIKSTNTKEISGIKYAHIYRID